MRNVRSTLLVILAALALLITVGSPANADDGPNALVASAFPDADAATLVPIVVIYVDPSQVGPIAVEVVSQIGHSVDPGDPGLPPD